MNDEIKIVDYTDTYHDAFKALNLEWIEKYFKVESTDLKALDHPKQYILDSGGHIYVALLDDKPVGVCALIKKEHPQYDYELAKMGVAPAAQGRGIGFLLGQAIIEKARGLGAEKIYLETNDILKPAIKLYKKLGFEEISGIETPYERSNYQMQLSLQN